MLKTALAMLAALAGLTQAQAQSWPTRPVTIVVPFAAGATPDIIARIVGDGLQARLGQPFVIENKPGASGNLGTASVAQAQPDGYVLGVSIIGPLALNAWLFPRMPYDTARDLALVSMLASQTSVLVVNGDLGVKNTGELLALLRKNPGKYNFGSIGVGSLSHLAVESLAMQSGTKLTHVPYRGSPPVVTDLIRGDVQIAILPIGAVAPIAATGQLKMLAVSSAQRSEFAPALPTLKEGGIAEIEADAWVGLIAPAKTSDMIKDKLEREVRTLLQDPVIREKLKIQLIEAVGGSSSDFRDRLAAEAKRWEFVIKEKNIRIEP